MEYLFSFHFQSIFNEDRVIETISPKKDVDGFHPISVGNLVIGKDTFASCTPQEYRNYLNVTVSIQKESMLL